MSWHGRAGTSLRHKRVSTQDIVYTFLLPLSLIHLREVFPPLGRGRRGNVQRFRLRQYGILIASIYRGTGYDDVSEVIEVYTTQRDLQQRSTSKNLFQIA